MSEHITDDATHTSTSLPSLQDAITTLKNTLTVSNESDEVRSSINKAFEAILRGRRPSRKSAVSTIDWVIRVATSQTEHDGVTDAIDATLDILYKRFSIVSQESS
jgi:hypothetical protein